jgi:hypothetical protein
MSGAAAAASHSQRARSWTSKPVNVSGPPLAVDDRATVDGVVPREEQTEGEQGSAADRYELMPAQALHGAGPYPT